MQHQHQCWYPEHQPDKTGMRAGAKTTYGLLVQIVVVLTGTVWNGDPKTTS